MGNERRALDALIVSQLRAHSEADVNNLPELTEEERDALDSLGPNFVEKLLIGDIEPPVKSTDDKPELAAAGEIFGMNRAKDIDEKTKEELDKKRKEIIERVKKMEREDAQPDE